MLAVGDYHSGLLVVIFTYKSAYINQFLLLDLNALVLSSQDLKSTCWSSGGTKWETVPLEKLFALWLW